MTVAVTEQKLDASGAAIGSATPVVTTQTLTAFNTAYGTTGVTLSAVPAGFSAAYTFTVSLPSTSAAVDNTYQGLGASQPLAWQFTS